MLNPSSLSKSRRAVNQIVHQSLRHFTFRTEPKPKPDAQFLQSGYWNPERRRLLKILTIAFPFMIGSGIALGQQFFGEDVQNQNDVIERQRLRTSIQQLAHQNKAQQAASPTYEPQLIDMKNQ